MTATYTCSLKGKREVSGSCNCYIRYIEPCAADGLVRAALNSDANNKATHKNGRQ